MYTYYITGFYTYRAVSHEVLEKNFSVSWISYQWFKHSFRSYGISETKTILRTDIYWISLSLSLSFFSFSLSLSHSHSHCHSHFYSHLLIVTLILTLTLTVTLTLSSLSFFHSHSLSWTSWVPHQVITRVKKHNN